MRGFVDKLRLMLKSSWTMLLLFQVFFHIFTSLIVYPLCSFVFNTCLRLSGIGYFTADNILRFLRQPLMIVCIAFIVLVFTLTVLLDLSCIMFCLHRPHIVESHSLVFLMREGIRDCLRALRFRNIPILFVTAYLTPLIMLPSDYSPLRMLHLPWTAIWGMALQAPLIYIIIAYILFWLLQETLMLGSLPSYILGKKNGREIFERSVVFKTTKRLNRILGMCLVVFLSTTGIFAITWLAGYVLAFVLKTLHVSTVAYSVVLLPINTINTFLRAVVPPVMWALYVVYIYRMQNDLSFEEAECSVTPLDKRTRKRNRLTLWGTALCFLIYFLAYDGWIRPTLVRTTLFEYLPGSPIVVAAHRGDTAEADENTLAAFDNAWEKGADLIELDVQLTSDGVVIVNHDRDYKRIFGSKKVVSETSYSEVLDMKAPITGECPPTLIQVLTLCDPRMNFIIELKGKGRTTKELPGAVYEILSAYDSLDRCIIQSSSYSMLKAFKELSPDTRCGIILSFALGSYEKLEGIDFYSIDESFVDAKTVIAVHRRGKDIYAWTVNRSRRMQELIELGVDGMITDSVELAKAETLTVNASYIEEIIIPDELTEIIDEFDGPVETELPVLEGS